MTKGQMWGACELNQTPSVEAKWAQDNDNPHAPYHTFGASKQTQAGAGIALFINKQVLTSPGQVVYTHPMGKALAVNISLNAVPFLVVVIHAPSRPTQPPAFFQSLIQAIKAPQPGRKVILMGDFNFVLRPEVDVTPAAPSSTREQASTEALNQLADIADHFALRWPTGRIPHRQPRPPCCNSHTWGAYNRLSLQPPPPTEAERFVS